MTITFNFRQILISLKKVQQWHYYLHWYQIIKPY